MGRQARGDLRHDPVHPGSRRRHPRQRRAGRRLRLCRVHLRRPLRPPQGRPVDQAVHQRTADLRADVHELVRRHPEGQLRPSPCHPRGAEHDRGAAGLRRRPRALRRAGLVLHRGPSGTPRKAPRSTTRATPRRPPRLAEEAGYNGEPISLLVSTNYQQHFDQANVFKRQLADAGINVELNVVDWATLLKQRAEPGAWDMFMTHHSTLPEPALLTFMNDNYPGWWHDRREEGADHRSSSAPPTSRSARPHGPSSRRSPTSRCRP